MTDSIITVEYDDHTAIECVGPDCLIEEILGTLLGRYDVACDEYQRTCDDLSALRAEWCAAGSDRDALARSVAHLFATTTYHCNAHGTADGSWLRRVTVAARRDLTREHTRDRTREHTRDRTREHTRDLTNVYECSVLWQRAAVACVCDVAE